MILGEILKRARRLLDDETAPWLWQDEELTGYANDCMEELCTDALVLTDSASEEVCRIALEAGQGEYQLDNRVVAIKRAIVDGAPLPLIKTTRIWLDRCCSNWEVMTGSPINYLMDGSSNHITLWPAPKEDGVLRLTVYRLPLRPLSVEAMHEEPEVSRRHHHRLLDGILWRAWRKAGSGTFNPEQGERHRLLWDKAIEEARRERVRVEVGEMPLGPVWGAV